ncbi:hypothetical protein D9619_003791 [Psilocybe cf. subviscida]|uniref:Uncharacterized protein n=1 Tax=Psilocybe cf. subviscida TaxID=2480587 RepID=A0A8H5AXI5_9AGAR|nr:hypothetical protein D9619_003791 [Psilocybe cf. subviscida]
MTGPTVVTCFCKLQVEVSDTTHHPTGLAPCVRLVLVLLVVMTMVNGDIVYEIIEHIAQRDRQTILLNLSLVNHSFLHITRPILFADVKWPHPKKTNEQGLMFFPQSLWGYLKTFHLNWPAGWPQGDPPLWGSKAGGEYIPAHLHKLETALPLMTSLHTFQITCPFDPPLSLFKVLRACISIRDLRITDTPFWDALKEPDPLALFTAERVTFSPVAEVSRVGEGPIDKKYYEFMYYRAEYRSRYLDLMQKRSGMGSIPTGWSFLPHCQVEIMTYLQLSGEYCCLDDFTNPHLFFPVLETLILTGPCPSVLPDSVMTLPAVISLMPKLRDLRVLISHTPTEHPLAMVPFGSETSLVVYGQLTSLAMSNEVQDIETVLRYANGLERLAISAIKPNPRLPIALRWEGVSTALDQIREGGGGKRLKQFRIMCEDDLDVTFIMKLGEVCPVSR